MLQLHFANFPVQNIAEKEAECLMILYQHILDIAYCILVLLHSDLLPGETIYNFLNEKKDGILQARH